MARLAPPVVAGVAQLVPPAEPLHRRPLRVQCRGATLDGGRREQSEATLAAWTASTA